MPLAALGKSKAKAKARGKAKAKAKGTDLVSIAASESAPDDAAIAAVAAQAASDAAVCRARVLQVQTSDERRLAKRRRVPAHWR